MNDNPVTLTTIGRLLRHRWPFFLVLAVLGGVLGLGSSFAVSPGYASSSKVLLQGSREKEAVPSEVRIATSSIVLDRVAIALNWGVSGLDLQPRISASVLDGNVVEIVGSAPSPQQAQQLTEVATREYVSFSSQIVGDAAAALNDAARRNRDNMQQRLDEARKRVTDMSPAAAAAEPGADGDQARSDLQQAQATADQLAREIEESDRQQQEVELSDSLTRANLRVIEPAVLPAGPASPTRLELIIFGVVLVPLLGVVGCLVALGADRRVRGRSELGAMLGAPVLAEVTAPAEHPSGLFAVFRDDRRWVAATTPAPDDERSRRLRFRRVLDRLRYRDGPQQVTVVMFQDDPAARPAIVDLALTAVADGRTVVVRTANRLLAESAQVASTASAGGRLTVAEPSGRPFPVSDLMLDVEELTPVRPVVPEGAPADPVLVVVTVGTRTAFELSAVAGAGLDAGRRLGGVLVLVPGDESARRATSGEQRSNHPASTTPVGSA